jgi:DNA-binding response OmpR family regulator
MAKKILIVDDEPDIVELIGMRLTAKSYDIIKAFNGEDALRMAREEKPDLIILDVLMPPPDGLQVCSTLKKDASYKNIPIILLSAKATEKDRETGKQCGADEYLTKPFENKDLLDNIKKLLRE